MSMEHLIWVYIYIYIYIYICIYKYIYVCIFICIQYIYVYVYCICVCIYIISGQGPWRASERPKAHDSIIMHTFGILLTSDRPLNLRQDRCSRWVLKWSGKTAQRNPISIEMRMRSGLEFRWVFDALVLGQLIHFHGAPESTLRLNYQFHYLRTVLLMVYVRNKVCLTRTEREGWRSRAWSVDGVPPRA